MPNSPGHRPCTELETRAGIWRYEASGRGSGSRPPSASSPESATRRHRPRFDGVGIYATQHGRDPARGELPALYKPEQGANLPAEELVRVERGADYGCPNATSTTRSASWSWRPSTAAMAKGRWRLRAEASPVAVFPAHWAPNDLALYYGDPFPVRYRGGAFIAFHGSWNRAPFPQGGYNVVFQPLATASPPGSTMSSPMALPVP